jgi:hypothetical protein
MNNALQRLTYNLIVQLQFSSEGYTISEFTDLEKLEK